MIVESGASEQKTRMIAAGSAALMAGFGLIGFETIPDAGPEDIESLLAELVRGNQKAIVVVECELAHCDDIWFKRVRNEGGRIVITEVPSLNAPASYRPRVEDLVVSILGPSALEERP